MGRLPENLIAWYSYIDIYRQVHVTRVQKASITCQEINVQLLNPDHDISLAGASRWDVLIAVRLILTTQRCATEVNGTEIRTMRKLECAKQMTLDVQKIAQLRSQDEYNYKLEHETILRQIRWIWAQDNTAEVVLCFALKERSGKKIYHEWKHVKHT